MLRHFYRAKIILRDSSRNPRHYKIKIAKHPTRRKNALACNSALRFESLGLPFGASRPNGAPFYSCLAMERNVQVGFRLFGRGGITLRSNLKELQKRIANLSWMMYEGFSGLFVWNSWRAARSVSRAAHLSPSIIESRAPVDIGNFCVTRSTRVYSRYRACRRVVAGILIITTRGCESAARVLPFNGRGRVASAVIFHTSAC